MALNAGIQLAVNNTYVGLENIILIAIIAGSLIFFAKDFNLGILVGLFIPSGVASLLLYMTSYDYTKLLTLFCISAVLLAISFYAIDKSHGAGTPI